MAMKVKPMPKYIHFIGCTPFAESVDMSSAHTVQWTLEQKTFLFPRSQGKVKIAKSLLYFLIDY